MFHGIGIHQKHATEPDIRIHSLTPTHTHTHTNAHTHTHTHTEMHTDRPTDTYGDDIHILTQSHTQKTHTNKIYNKQTNEQNRRVV